MKKIESFRNHLPSALMPYYQSNLLVKKGRMQYLWDSEDRKYLDFFAGVCTVSVGHCHPKVNKALRQQAEQLWHTTSIYLTEPVYEYSQMLTSTMPAHLNVFL